MENLNIALAPVTISLLRDFRTVETFSRYNEMGNEVTLQVRQSGSGARIFAIKTFLGFRGYTESAHDAFEILNEAPLMSNEEVLNMDAAR